MRPIKIIKNRSDIGAGTRGSDIGIDALEIAAINSNNDFFNKYLFDDVKTHNESIYDKVKCTFAKRIGFVLEQCERLRDKVFKNLNEGYFPLILSGDHSSSIGTMAAIHKHLMGNDFGVIWIDAHADLHTPFTTPSGNVHGMPLAAALGSTNPLNKVNEVDNYTLSNWNKLTKLGFSYPILKSKNLVYLGLRDIEKQEKEYILKNSIKNFNVQKIRLKGIDNFIEDILKCFTSVKKIYISFDVDSLDPDSVSQGTGTPVNNGFEIFEVISIIKAIIKTNKVIALEVSEINPLLDKKGNIMAEKTFEIIKKIFNY
ncbi:MAG: arginase [Flavobacteriaceae bacterium]